jgi:Na+-driven multidrug efflux pump
MGVLPGAIRGLGSSIPPSLITIFGTCGIRIIWVYTIFKQYPSLRILYLVHPITWVFTITALVITLRIVYKNTKIKLEKNKKRIYVRKARRTV